MSVNFLAECKKIPEKKQENYCYGQICHKFTHFPSVKFPGLNICECKKNDKYQVWFYVMDIKMFYVYHGRRLVGHRCDPVYVHNIAAIQMKFVNPR